MEPLRRCASASNSHHGVGPVPPYRADATFHSVICPTRAEHCSCLKGALRLGSCPRTVQERLAERLALPPKNKTPTSIGIFYFHATL